MIPPAAGKGSGAAGQPSQARSRPVGHNSSSSGGSSQMTHAKAMSSSNNAAAVRPATARSATTNARPDQAARPRSAASTVRPTTSMAPPAGPSTTAVPSTAGDDESETATSPPTPTKKVVRRAAQAPASGDAEETNIQVVVRCRGHPSGDKEPPIVAPGSGAKTKTVTIQVSPSLSAVDPVLALAATKTYTFDRVFAHEADQGQVYQEVVAPILSEVLMGYNCTIFAYGQTGTGKTYTMEGDLSDRFGTYADKAGIIPRALYKLFHTLEQSTSEYSVRASYIELYNEELRDLLGPEENVVAAMNTANLGSSKQATQPEPAGLRIFDDASKKGVVIQGIEETLLANAADAIKLLRKGSNRRQSAATKCNDHSSRSHSVFTITVHIKETTPKGEEYLKIGKLNLVDLAGSENISRSGAENKRAREAGMINQSLLTLGRVINALVERSSHIPYRESKLTRLLQDSLGGRTKTCIIATISSQKLHAEETLSTLDYASRAKNIRNKPELNQKMTKKAFIKEYAAEIEKLKSDLVATRDKNGVFLSQQSFEDMVNENESQRVEVEDLKRQLEVSDSALLSVREQFEQNMVLLASLEKRMDILTKEIQLANEKLEFTETQLQVTSEKLAITQDKLESTTEELAVTKEELALTRRLLNEERVLREAHQSTETSLDTVAHDLVGTVESTIEDIGSLHARVQRQSALEAHNHGTLAEAREHFSTLREAVTVTVHSMQDSTQGLQKEFKDLISQQVSSHQTATRQLDQDTRSGLGDLSSLADRIRGQIETGQTFSTESHSLLVAKINELSTLHEKSQDHVQTSVAHLLSNMQEHEESLLSQMDVMLAGIRHVSTDALDLTFRHLTHQVNRNGELERALGASYAEKSAALKQRIKELEEFQETSAAQSEKSNSQLLAGVTELISQHARQRHESICGAVAGFTAKTEEEVTNSAEMHSRQLEMVRNIVEADEHAMHELPETRSKIDESLQNSKTNVSALVAKNEGIRKDWQVKTEEELAGHNQTISRSSNEMKAHAALRLGMLEEQLASQRAGMLDLASSSQRLQKTVSRQIEEVEAMNSSSAKALAAPVDDHAGSMQKYTSIADQRLHGMEVASDRYLGTEIKSYESTGSTPVKRKYDYLATWDRTLPHEEILANLETQTVPAVEPEIQSASSSPSKAVVTQTPLYIDTIEEVVDRSMSTLPSVDGPLKPLLGRKTMSPSSKAVESVINTKPRGKSSRTVSSGHVGVLDKENAVTERAAKRHQTQRHEGNE